MTLDDLQRAAARCWEHAGHPERAAQRWSDARSWADAGRCWGKAGRHVDSANAYALAGEALAEARQWLESPWPERARSAYSRVKAGSATAAAKVEALLGLGEGAALRHALALSEGAEHLEAVRAMTRLAASRGRPDVASQIWAGSVDISANSGRDFGGFASWNRSLHWARPEAVSPTAGWPVATCRSVALALIWEQRIGQTMFGDRALDWSADSTQFVAALLSDGLGWGQVSEGRIQFERWKHARGTGYAKFMPGEFAVLTGHADGEVRLSKKDGSAAPIEALRMPGAVWHIAFSPRGDRVAVSSLGRLRILEWSSGRPGEEIETLQDSEHDFAPLCAWSPERLRLVWSTASGSQKNRLVIAALEGQRDVPEAHRGDVRSLAFTPAGRLLISASVDKTVVVRCSQDGQPLAPQERFDNSVYGVSVHPQAALLAVGEGREIHLIRLDLGHSPQLARLSEHPMAEDVRSLAFSPDGRRLLVMTGEGGIGRGHLYLFRVDLNI